MVSPHTNIPICSPQAQTSKPLPRSEYLSTTIVLDVADSAFGDTLALNLATSSGLTTSDNGKTWSVDTISVPAYTY